MGDFVRKGRALDLEVWDVERGWKLAGAFFTTANDSEDVAAHCGTRVVVWLHDCSVGS